MNKIGNSSKVESDKPVMSNDDSFSNFVAPVDETSSKNDETNQEKKFSEATDELNLQQLAEDTNVELKPDHLKRDSQLNKVEMAAKKVEQEE